jgi:hypothetical protein
MEENKVNISKGQEMNRLKMILNKYKINRASNKGDKGDKTLNSLSSQNNQNIQEDKNLKSNNKPTFSISIPSDSPIKNSRNSQKTPVNNSSSGVNNLENFEIPSNNKHLLKILYDYNKQEKSPRKKSKVQGNYNYDSNTMPIMSEPSTSSSRTQNNKNSSTFRSNDNRGSFSNVLAYMKNSKNLNQKNSIFHHNNNLPSGIQPNTSNNPLFLSNNTNFFEYEDNHTGASVLNLNQNNNFAHVLNFSEPSATSSLMSTVAPEHPKIVVHNCDNIVKSIGEKITNLKLKLIQDDIKFRIDMNKLLFNHNILKIVKFMGGDIYGLYKCNKMLNDIIRSYISYQSQKIIKKFVEVYDRFFEIADKYVVITKNKNKSKKN